MKILIVFIATALLTANFVTGTCTLSKAGRCAQDFGRNSHRAMGNKKILCQAISDNNQPASCTSYHINPKFCLELVVHRTFSNDIVLKWWYHKRSTSWTMPKDPNPGWRAAQEFKACIHDLGECRGMPKTVIDRTIKKIINTGCKLHNSSTTIKKSQMTSILLPFLLLGQYIQSRI